jgi:hypothetical protein
MFTIIIALIIFLMGLYFYSKKNTKLIQEGFLSDKNKLRCPNLLIQHGASFYLYNTDLAEVPGVNPIEFNNLEEYTEFLKWQRSVGIRCPVLYLQHSYDAQNNTVYKVRPSVTELQGGLPPVQHEEKSLLIDASRDDYPYNKNSLPGIDIQDQDIGRKTPLDVESSFDMYSLSSDNAMNTNWDPIKAQQNIDSGVYKDNEVNIFVP